MVGKTFPRLTRWFVVALATAFWSFVQADEPAADEAPDSEGVSGSRLLAPPDLNNGRILFEQQCSSCHGDKAEGVPGAYERSLTGDLSITQLAQLITETMPEGEPHLCAGQQALDVAAFLHDAFYSEAAQIRNQPPQLQLSRLTAEQTRQCLADLYAALESGYRYEKATGLTGNYFNRSQRGSEHKVLERIDPVINFDFGRESPGLEIPVDDFAIHWSGGLKASDSELVEIVIRSTCSFMCHLGRRDRVFIDNHVQSGDSTEFRREIFLTAGRIYPFSLTFIQRKRTTELPPASISVSWIRPGRTEQLIPPEHWVSQSGPAAFSLQTQLPPDDRSYGYERGIGIDRQWDQAVTEAVLEFARIVQTELWPDYQKNHADKNVDSRELLAELLGELLGFAFRAPLDQELATRLVHDQLQKEADDGDAIKRVLLLGLKSPRFLYPFADSHLSASSKAGSRLALTLMDSLPVERKLQQAIAQDELQTEQQIREMARYLLDDERVQAKVRRMLLQWLSVENAIEIKKHAELYPDFDQELVGDLRASFIAFLESIVWSPSSDYREFFTADWSFSTSHIHQFYGPDWAPAEPRVAMDPTSTDLGEPTELGDSTDAKPPIPEAVYNGLYRTSSAANRAGVLNHPYLLSRLAYPEHTSPIHRGVFLLRSVLGRSLQPPQDAFSPLSPDLHPELTTRQRVELQTSPESCQACHRQINKLGFCLENWDAVGRFRQQEQSQPIDASGSYVNRDGHEVQWTGAEELAKMLAISRDAHQAFVRRAFHHFTQQSPASYGADTLERLTDRFIQNAYNIKELLVDIAATSSVPPTQPNAESVTHETK